MKKLTFIAFFLSLFTNGFSSDLLADKIKFASIEKSNVMLTQEDEFTKSWSQFDIDSRMHKSNSTKKDLFNFIKEQTREWTIGEQDKINSICKSIDKEIKNKGYKISFPDEIYFVKTTAKEEGGAAGYTRHKYIVLKDNILSQKESVLKKTIVHELFHVLTRNNAEFRKKMYQIIGFELMNDVAYPNNLKKYRITNPDAPQVDSYISIKVGNQSKNCMMILYSNRDYNGGDFFKYLNVGFLSLIGDTVKKIEYVNDKPVIYSFPQIKGFFEQVGKNTQYIIHPEEILADNFAYTILDTKGLPNPEIVSKIRMELLK